VVLDIIRKMTSTVLLKRGKNDGITAYVPKKTTLKVMAAQIE
jgi:nitrogen fixation protein